MEAAPDRRVEHPMCKTFASLARETLSCSRVDHVKEPEQQLLVTLVAVEGDHDGSL